MGVIGPVSIPRREVLVLGAGVLTLAVSGCHKKTLWHESDISGSLPPLSFSMTDATTGKPVTAGDFLGKVTLLYFGYTLCPDFCPTTLTNLADVLKKLGAEAQDVRVLFVTVDPNRDKLPVLKRYVGLFAPQMVGLRGTPDELAALARRYRVAYSVTPAHDGRPYEVTHSSLVYVFDQNGNARLLVDSMATQKPDVVGAEDDLRRLIEQHRPARWWAKIERAV
jgi:protein SCO1/2